MWRRDWDLDGTAVRDIIPVDAYSAQWPRQRHLELRRRRLDENFAHGSSGRRRRGPRFVASVSATATLSGCRAIASALAATTTATARHADATPSASFVAAMPSNLATATETTATETSAATSAAAAMPAAAPSAISDANHNIHVGGSFERTLSSLSLHGHMAGRWHSCRCRLAHPCARKPRD